MRRRAEYNEDYADDLYAEYGSCHAPHPPFLPQTSEELRQHLALDRAFMDRIREAEAERWGPSW